MRHLLLILAGAVCIMTTSSAQQIQPGDRPAGNLRGTRSPAVGRHGMIATSQTLASAAGLKALQDGGNAIDAAVTAAAVLAVIEPSMNGIGGDLLAIVYDASTRKVYGLDSTGRSAYAATPEEFKRRGLTQMPGRGPLSVDVPGVVEGWDQLLKRFGTISLATALGPAIGYARDGFPVAELMADEWSDNLKTLSADKHTADTFLPQGKPLKQGEIFANPRLARSLELIAKEGRDAFYTGSIAKAIVADMKARDGLLEMRDFAEHKADWVDTISTTYRGYDVHEMPPSTQGFIALEMLNIMEGFDIKALGHNSADYLHVVTEAKRIAFADRSAVLSDRDHMPKDALKRLLSKDYAATRRKDINMAKVTPRFTTGIASHAPKSSQPEDFYGRDLGDTIYMTAADGRGNVISFIQSLFGSFGAGFAAGETGITLQNRGSGFNLTPGHPNEIGPHKRPLHTLVPAMIVKDGKPWVSFGVMGGDNQAQAHAQIVANFVDFGMHVQEAGDAARMRHMGQELALESGIGADVRKALEAKGHLLRDGRGQMGGYQAIFIDPRTGVLLGGSDLRKDGLAIGW
ncbi:MAG: gamma-glutamyltransferase [Acidimicrobiia bacterium]|nr:gamma-glutamyltransferase [Acidimicrobiia bacterium]